MPKPKLNKPIHQLIIFMFVAMLVTLSYHFVDRELAAIAFKLLIKNKLATKYTSDIPDILLLLVCAISITAFTVYRFRKNRYGFDVQARFYQLLTYALPASFILKTVMKQIFGQVTTREWLLNPRLYGFHWFHGGGRFDGFPSGHMAVFATLTAVLWRFYPRYRHAYSAFLALLAVALLATDYHFLSDVIAGAYLGVVVAWVTQKMLGLLYEPKPGRVDNKI